MSCCIRQAATGEPPVSRGPTRKVLIPLSIALKWKLISFSDFVGRRDQVGEGQQGQAELHPYAAAAEQVLGGCRQGDHPDGHPAAL
jgi:hypothetical protein